MLPKTARDLKFLLFPLIAIPIACIIAFNSPSRNAHEAALQAAKIEALQPQAETMMDVAALFQNGTSNMALLRGSSTECNNLMGDGWHVGKIEPRGGGQVIRICWHQYGNFETAWDGAHYGRPIVAVCPLIDGMSRYEDCINVPSASFQWQP